MTSDIRKLRHNDDPSTSHEAIAKHSASGRRATNLARVEAGLKKYPHLTANELAAHISMESYEVRRRLTDLKNQGRAVQGKRRACSVKGSSMVTWHTPVPTTLFG